MLINDITNKDEICALIVTELRGFGIKYRKDKKAKNGQEKNVKRKIFHTPLHQLELTDVILSSGGIAQVPQFVSDACQRILEQVSTEGLFRKAGSTTRQKDIRAGLEAGNALGKSHHVIDVANIVKSFFRELPDSLLPSGNIQEAMIRCLMCGDRKVYALMMTCLLLPPLSLNILAFFMQFLKTVAMHCDENRMTVENLAIIFTPGLMPPAEIVGKRLNSHVQVIRLLIENAHDIGVVPEMFCEKTKCLVKPPEEEKQKKKKRRSGSLTRMFNGIRKIVSGIGSNEQLDESEEPTSHATPCMKASKKRRVADVGGFSAKKKKVKEVLALLPESSAILPSTPVCPKETKRSRLSLGGRKFGKSQVSLPAAVAAPIERRWSIVGSSWNRKKQSTTTAGYLPPHLSPVASLPCLNIESCTDTATDDSTRTNEDYVKVPKSEYEAIKERMCAIETRISQEFGQVKSSLRVATTADVEPPVHGGPETVQDEYQKTLEETESMNHSPSTDHLAKRLSRELKIRRRSSEHKVVFRSPSARKIGTLRRRSRELSNPVVPVPASTRLSRNLSWHIGTQNGKEPEVAVTSSFYPRVNLKRGRPNTIQTGLRAPPSPARQTKTPAQDQWTAADQFFGNPANDVHNDEEPSLTPRRSSLRVPQSQFVTNIVVNDVQNTPMLPPQLPPKRTPSVTRSAQKTELLPMSFVAVKSVLTPLQELQTGRASIARIRSQNAGMVMAKARLFDEMVVDSVEQTTDTQTGRILAKAPRRRNINTSKSPRTIQRRNRQTNFACDSINTATKALRIDDIGRVIEDMCSPTAARNRTDVAAENRTPQIKRALITRSPRRLMKTPARSTVGGQTPLRATPNAVRSSPRLAMMLIDHQSPY